MTDGLQIERVCGEAIRPYLQAIAALRITVFREFPYLYDGDPAYEARYLQTYVDTPRSLIVLVRDGERIVGASSALPMVDETEAFIRPFIANDYDPARVFYCAESVLLPEYRGKGLGVRFFDEREAHARSLGGFDWITFCAVQRPADHPRRPGGYQPLDAFWTRRGFKKHPELATTYTWQDLDETQETAKPMVFWMKRLG